MSAVRIDIDRSQLAASANLVANSALWAVTELGSDENHNLFYVQRSPRFSSGERRLWAVLGWLNGVGDFPDVDDLRAWLDADSLAAALTALGVKAVA